MLINYNLKTEDLKDKLDHFWELSGKKILKIESDYDKSGGAPVFTINGKYTTRGWTEWTQGFQYGSSILQYDATGEESFLKTGKENTIKKMAPHISHAGVHDHGFNNVSTYGNLLRLMKEGKIPYDEGEKNFYELALKASGAVQANRWSKNKEGGYIYSFNGPHSLFVDTIRSVRVLMLSHALGHYLPEKMTFITLFLKEEFIICCQLPDIRYIMVRDVTFMTNGAGQPMNPSLMLLMGITVAPIRSRDIPDSQPGPED